MRVTTIAALAGAAVLLAACAASPKPTADSLDAVARDYVALTLEIGEREPGYVDAYYGPAEWAEAAKANPRALPQLAEGAAALTRRLEALPERGLDDQSRQRRAYLLAHVSAASARLRMLQGEKLGFADEAEALFGVRPELRPLSSYDPVLARIDALVPGEGPLAERVAIARDAGADLFISIHADSAPNRDARGLSAYTLSDKASDDFAFALAKQENLADGSGGIDLRHTRPQVAAILSDLVARHTVTASLMAKSSLVEGAGRSLRLLDNPKRSANFAVLKAPDVPSVLIETGFLSNPRDEDLLRDVAQRRRIADVLSRELADVMTSAPFA